MPAEKFYKIIAALAIAGAILWLWAYYLSVQRPLSAPDENGQQYGQNEHEQLLNSLRATQPATYTQAEREKLLQSLQAAKPAQYSNAEREKLLQSLRAQ